MKKSKKLGVKTSKLAVFDEEQFEVTSQNDAPASSEKNKLRAEILEKNEDFQILCSTIDKLTLDMFILMQQQMQQKLDIEKSMTDGELHLSKSRYIMGHKNVSSLQLPTKNSAEIDPSILVEEIYDDESMFGKPRLKLVTENFSKPNKEENTDKDNEENIQDPIKWFGVLVPRDLKLAQKKFRDALSYVVECANVQIKLHQTCIKIKQLMELKQEMSETNEE